MLYIQDNPLKKYSKFLFKKLILKSIYYLITHILSKKVVMTKCSNNAQAFPILQNHIISHIPIDLNA